MDKNTIFAIVLSTVVIVAGFTIQSVFFPPVKDTTSVQATVAAPQNTPETVAVSTETKALPISAATDPAAEGPSLVEEKSVIETDLVRVEFTNRGGDVVSYKLKQHGQNDNFLEMADFVSDQNRAFSLALGDANGAVINELFNTKKISDTEIGFYRSFSVQNIDGSLSYFTLAKQYTFIPDEYMFELKVTVDGDASFRGLNFGSAAYTLKTAPQIGPEWNPKQDKYEYRKFYQLLNGKKKAVSIGQNTTKKVDEKVSWTGVAGKYFTLIALPETPAQSVLYSTRPAVQGESAAQIFMTRGPISASRTTDTWRFYIGPRTDKFLTKYNIVTNNPYGLSDAKLDQIVESSGILGPLEILLKWLMEFFYKLIPNWGVSIIILTILMRLIIFPLTKKSSESTLKMQELQPKIQEIQAKYKENPQRMNEEMAKFYQQAGYNPMSGCLPMLIQFPLIFAMYNLFNNYFEFRGALFIPGWIPDLSQGDSLMLLPFTVPFLGWTDLRILPFIYVVSQLLFGKVTQTPSSTPQNGSMKFMLYGMPLMFFFIFYNAPSGLLVYWIFSNLLTLVQQVIINKSLKQKKESGLKLVKK